MAAENTPVIIYLIGGGGHAHSLLEMDPVQNVIFKCVVAPKQPNDLPLEYFGDDNDFFMEDWLIPPTIHFAMVANHTGDMSHRRRLITRYMMPYIQKVATLISSTAVVTKNSIIGNGCAIMQRAIVNKACIGDYTIVNTGAIIEHQCAIGSNTFIGPGSVLCGEVHVGDNCYIGAGVNIAPGVNIVSDTIIGIGSTILQDITEPGTYVGSPAHHIK